MYNQFVTKLLRCCLLAILVFSFSCQPDDKEESNSKPTADFSAELPQEWMTQAYNSVKRTGLFALDASRVYAYTAITMYDARVSL